MDVFDFALPVAVLAALLPAVVAFVTGRRLLARAQDPALPELLLARRTLLTRVFAVALAVLVVLGRGHAAWALPAMLAGLLLGNYPLRRALWEETWSIGAYLWAHVCATAAFFGLPLLAALTPAIVLSASAAGPRAAWAAAIACGAMLFLWQQFAPRIWLALSRATPLADAALCARFDAVAARSRVGAPAVYRFGHAGSALMNAIALPHAAHPAVAFSDTLLARLDRDAITAIYAHELSHLEQWDRRLLRRARVAGVALALLSPAVPLLVLRWDPAAGALLSWGWVVVVVFALGRRAARSRAHETESDLRAVELTGDGEALVRGLVALHAHARLPRRWSHEFERAASHPSLARRVQAIRAAAVAADGTPAAAPLAEPIVFRGADAGTWVAFDAERAHWGAGAPAATPDDLAALRAASSSYRTAAYGDLAELRVAADGDRRVLRAADRAGAAWTTVLRPGDVTTVQETLDLVDTRLGQRAAPAREPRQGRLVAALVLGVVLVAEQASAVLVPGLVALWRPTAPALAATGAMALVRGVVGLAAGDAAWASPWQRPAWALLAVLGAACVWLAWRRRGTPIAGSALLAPGLLIVVALFQLTPLVTAGAGDWAAALPLPALGLVATTLLGAGAALATGQRRRHRVGGAAVAAAAALLVAVTAGAERLTSGGDIAWTRAEATAVARGKVEGRAGRLRVSPDGRRWAVMQWAAPLDDEQDEDAEPRAVVREFVVADFAGHARTRRALDLAFADGDRLLALVRSDSALELRVEGVGDTAWSHRQSLPRLSVPVLTADAASGRWVVTGHDPVSGELVRLTGRVGAGGVQQRRWSARSAGWLAPMTFDEGASLVVPRNVPIARTAWPFLLAGASAFRFDLWRVDSAGGERRLGRLPGYPQCVQAAVGVEGYCVAREGMRVTLWRVDGRGAPGRVGSLPGVIGVPVAGQAHWLAPTYGDRGLVMVDVAGRRGVRVALPDSGTPREVVETPAGIAVLSDRWDGAGSRSEVVLYSVGDTSAREPAASGARGAPPEHHDTTPAAPDHHPSNADRVPASPRGIRPPRG